MRKTFALLALSAVSLWPAVALAETAVEREVTAVIEEYNNKFRELSPKLATAKTDAERAAVRAAAPRPDQYAPRLMKIVDTSPEDAGAVKALCWLATQASGTPESAKAIELIGTRYAASAGVWEAAQQLYRTPRAQAEPVLKAIIKNNTHPEDRCAATHALATVLFNASENLTTPEAKADREEAKRLFQEVVANYANVTIQGFKPADQSSAVLYEMENLAIGCTVPDIEGKDVDGSAFKLSEYRGKHVLLVFWGSWCHSCHYFLPQLRDLQTKLKDQPFAVVGVNSDILPELKTFLSKESVPWRNFADESSTGPISAVWNIRNWPTLYVIDAKGIIRAKNPSVGAVEEMVRGFIAKP